MEKNLDQDDIEFFLKNLGESNRPLVDNIKEYKRMIDNNELPKYKWVRENIIDFGCPVLIHLLDIYHIYQIYSEQFIEKLAEDINKHNAGRIVEVCAGGGHLSAFLRKFGVNSIPTDRKPQNDYVEELDFREALDKHKPDTVIICWEPYEAIITQEMMEHPDVERIFWIGERRGGCTGNRDTFDRYKHRSLNNEFCLCRTDHSFFVGGLVKHSDVYLFEKEESKKTTEGQAVLCDVVEEWVE